MKITVRLLTIAAFLSSPLASRAQTTGPIGYYPSGGTSVAPAQPKSGVGSSPTYDPMQNQMNSPNAVNKLPRVDVRHPDFGVGRPIGSITLTGTCTGTSTFTVTFTDSTGTVVVPAIANAGCNNGNLYSDAMIQEGEGYDASISCSAGVAGVSCVASLKGTAGAADPTGSHPSSAAFQQAVDWARAQGNANESTGPYPCVYIPQGYYTLDAPIDLNGVDCVEGDGPNATWLTPTGDFPAFTALGQYHYTSTTGGTNLRISGVHIVGNGIASHTGAIEGGDLIAAKMNNIAIENSAGYGIGTDAHSERNVFEDISEASLRLANLSYGNESWYINVNPQNIGATAKNITFDINSGPNGEIPAQGWPNTKLYFAQSDGQGYAMFTTAFNQASSASPAPFYVGNFFQVAGLTTLTELNNAAGTAWQATQVFQGCTLTATQVAPPYSSITLCPGTTTVGYITVVAKLQTGTLIPGPDWIAPVYQTKPTAVTVAVGVDPATSATWKPAQYTSYNPYWVVAGNQFHIIRSSIKSTQFTGGLQVVGVGNGDGLYIEGPINNAVSPGIQVGGANPYFFVQGIPATTPGQFNPLPATTAASIYAPLVITDSGHVHSRFRSYYHTPTWLNYFAQPVAFMCSDYNPTSMLPCANHPDIKQSQQENMLVVQDESAANNQTYIVQRMYTGSTVPAPVAWTTGDIMGYPNNLKGDGTVFTATNPHINTILAQNANQVVSMASDQSYFPTGAVMVGGIWDGVTNFPPGTAGQSYTTTAFTFDEWPANTSPQCALYEPQGYNCFKAIGYGNITKLGTMSTGVQTAEPVANINNCQMFTSGTFGGIITHFDATHWSAGEINDDATHTMLLHTNSTNQLNLPGCKYLGVTTNINNGNTPMALETYGGYSITDPTGDSLSMVPTENSTTPNLSYTPAGAPTPAFEVSHNSSSNTNIQAAGRPCTASSTTPLCGAPETELGYSYMNSSQVSTTGSVNEIFTFNGAGTSGSPVTGFNEIDQLTGITGLTSLMRDFTQWSQVKLPGYSTIGGHSILGTTNATPSGTCTASGFITATVYINGVATTVKLATC